MLLLSQLGCWLFSALGVLDTAGCEELRRAEERLDALTWLKLLFVPTLGLLVIALFVMDEHCTAHHRDRDRDRQPQAWNEVDDAAGGDVANAGWQQARAKANGGRAQARCGCSMELPTERRAEEERRAEHADTQRASTTTSHCRTHAPAHLSSAPSATPVAYSLLSSSPSSPLLHLLLLSESNQPTAYTLPPSLPLRDLLAFHSSRHHLHFDASLLLVFVDGKRVDQQRMGEAVERLGRGGRQRAAAGDGLAADDRD